MTVCVSVCVCRKCVFDDKFSRKLCVCLFLCEYTMQECKVNVCLLDFNSSLLAPI